MPVPSVPAGNAFFPPSMPSFWNSAAFLHQQQQMQSAFGGQGAVTSPPMSHHSQIPLFPPSVTAFPPLIPTPTLSSTGNTLMLGPLTAPGMPIGHSSHGPPGSAGFMAGNPLSPHAAPSPTFPSSVPTPSPPAGAGPGEMASGIGKLIWLSSQAGLIQSDGDCGVISFQLKTFCDQAVTDLTAVIRPGFTLKFQALVSASSQGDQWVATFVAPLHGSESQQNKIDIEANLESPAGTETGPPQLPKDPYDLRLEEGAIPMLLQIFRSNGSPSCQLSLFHCQISNCGDEELYRYVGTSSLKRRQFLERRTHLFSINSSDVVSLVPAPLHTTIVIMAERLLKRGGACLMQELFEYFNGCPEIPLEARDLIGDGKNKFLRFLEAHPFIFAVFPSRVFVSVRRHFPKLDYAAYIDEHFGDIQDTLMSGMSDKKMSNGWSEEAHSSGMMNGRSSGLGSNPCLAEMSVPPPQPGNPLPPGIPPTPTYSLPPTTPAWESHHGYAASGMGMSGCHQEATGPMDFAGKPLGVGGGSSWPEPKVGGRIKRFTDVEIQTETTCIGVGTDSPTAFRPLMVDAEVQTVPETTTNSTEPGDSPVPASGASPPNSLGSRENGNSLFSGWDNFPTADSGNRGEGGSFDPLFGGMSLMSIGGLIKGLGE